MKHFTQIYKFIFIWAVILCLCVPSLYFFGFKEKTILIGAETITALPSLQHLSFRKRKFQPEFEKYWNSHFAFRQLMLKSKNQLYDWLNLGRIHMGFSENIIEGRHRYLFGKYLFASVSKNCPQMPALDALEQFYRLAKAKNIDVYFVLAPSKALTYYKNLPKRYKYFLDSKCSVYPELARAISHIGIPVYNTQPLIEKLHAAGGIEPFPIGGIHWNLYGAGNALKESANYFKWGKIEITGVEHSATPYYSEQDLTLLQNLFITKRNDKIFYKPVLKSHFVWKDKTVLIGDSYSNEYDIMLREANIINPSKLTHYENKPLTEEDVKNIWASKRIIFVYTDSIIQESHQFYKKLNALIQS